MDLVKKSSSSMQIVVSKMEVLIIRRASSVLFNLVERGYIDEVSQDFLDFLDNLSTVFEPTSREKPLKRERPDDIERARRKELLNEKLIVEFSIKDLRALADSLTQILNDAWAKAEWETLIGFPLEIAEDIIKKTNQFLSI